MLQVYNSLSGKKETFTPIEQNAVKMYVCGITAYDYCHAGHGRSSVAFDVIRRYLIHSGYDVLFVKNFTDIDDKIIDRAKELNVSCTELTDRFIDEHDADMEMLNVMSPNEIPKATEYIEEMIEFVAKLIKKGHAYVSNNDVYYDVTSFADYGKLSKRNVDDMVAGARVEINDNKRNPMDFVLWKASKDGEPSWESPWGNGRPGWHIECSAMSVKLLGETFDIHGGGVDLVFPHHENEIAQSEALHEKAFANYWIHNGFLVTDSTKMSKSLGNFFTLRDILSQFHPEVIRYYFTTTHYRQPLEFSFDRIIEAETALERIYNYLYELGLASGTKGKDQTDTVKEMLDTFKGRFKSSMDDDFNTPMSLGALFEFIRKGNTILSEKPDESTLTALRSASGEVIGVIKDVFGVVNLSPAEYYDSNLTMEKEELTKLISERDEARHSKDFAKSDAIRDKLGNLGIELKDTADGTRYSVKRIR